MQLKFWFSVFIWFNCLLNVMFIFVEVLHHLQVQGKPSTSYGNDWLLLLWSVVQKAVDLLGSLLWNVVQKAVYLWGRRRSITYYLTGIISLFTWMVIACIICVILSPEDQPIERANKFANSVEPVQVVPGYRGPVLFAIEIFALFPYILDDQKLPLPSITKKKRRKKAPKYKNKYTEITDSQNMKLRDEAIQNYETRERIKKQKREMIHRIRNLVLSYWARHHRHKVCLQSQSHQAGQTGSQHVGRLRRELVILENTLAAMRDRLHSLQRSNKQAVQRYHTIHQQITGDVIVKGSILAISPLSAYK